MPKGKTREQIKKLVELYYKQNKDTKLTPVRYGGSTHNQEEALEMINAVLDGWWVGGKRTRLFEDMFNKYLNNKYSILCNSGSSALILALDSLGLKKGSEVISPALTFPTTINPSIRQGMNVTLVDSDIGTYNINVDDLERSITKKTKLLVLPHIMGNMSDMKRIMDLVEDYKIILIEDCCESLGSKYGNKLLGSFGVSSAFSFFPSHHISAGGGGLFSTSDKKFYIRSLSLKNWGRQYSDVKYIPNQRTIRSDYVQQYTYETIGYNLNANELIAAQGIVQMKKLNRANKERDKNFNILSKFFKKYKDYFILPRKVKKAKPAWFAFPITINTEATKFTREELMNFLFKKTIESRYILCGNISRQPAYKRIKFKKIGNLDNANRIFTDSFFIGVYPGINRKKMKYLQESFIEFLE